VHPGPAPIHPAAATSAVRTEINRIYAQDITDFSLCLFNTQNKNNVLGVLMNGFEGVVLVTSHFRVERSKRTTLVPESRQNTPHRRQKILTRIT
jgi:hypothetical protein